MPSIAPPSTKIEPQTGVESLCQYLDWDSAFFARRIGSIRESRLRPETLVEIEGWCGTHRIDCLYFLADLADPETIQLAEERSFHLVDIRLTLGIKLPSSLSPGSASSGIRLGRAEDIPTLRSIARTNHRDSRFYFDPNFPRESCDRLYETWIEKSCRGFADVVFVPELCGKPAGYISCHMRPNRSGQIGLVGLSQEARGKGLGRELVKASLFWFESTGANQITVVTQGRNVAAQRLYQRCGFSTQSVQLWYHRWFRQ